MSTIKLGEILKLEYGKPLPKEKRITNGIYPVYGANGIKDWANLTYVDKPAIIVGRKGSAGELVISNGPFWPLDVTYYVTFDERKYDLKYIYWLLKTLNLPSLAKGVKPGINRNDVYNIVIDKPKDITQQIKIAKSLDSAFEKIDKAIELSEMNLLNSRDIFRVTLEKTFKSLLSDGEHVFLPEIVKNEKYAIKRGPFGSTLRKSYFVEKGYKIYEQKNAIRDNCHIGRYYINEQMFGELIAFAAKPGDILISCSGTIGRTTIVPENAEVGIINQALLKVTIDPNKMPLEYFRYFFNWMVQGGGIDEKTKGSAIKNIVSVKELKNTPIPVPNKDLNEILKVVGMLDVAKSNSTKLESVLQIKLDKLLNLKSSILDKAFKAEL